jgi:hypothetical protein
MSNDIWKIFLPFYTLDDGNFGQTGMSVLLGREVRCGYRMGQIL